MGRVLPSLTTRTGVVGAADAIAPTKDQQLRNAMRRAALQRAAARKTPEGMMKLIRDAAGTVSAVTSAGEKVASAIGKIPISRAMREAAAAKATREGVLPEVKETITDVVERTGIGLGAPITEESAAVIRETGETGPGGRLAAQALRKQALEDIEMRSGRDRSAAAEAEVEEVEEYFRPTDKDENLTADEAAAASVQATGEAERFVDESVSPVDQRAVARRDDVLEGVQVATGDDIESAQVEQFVGSLGTNPIDRQERLLGMAKNAYDPKQQKLLFDAVEFMDVAPSGRVADLFGDPRESFRRKLSRAMPSRAEMLRFRGQDIREQIAKDTRESRADIAEGRRQLGKDRLDFRAEQHRDKETRHNRELMRRFKKDDADQNYRWAKLEARKKIEADRNKSRETVAKLRKRSGRGGRSGAGSKLLRSAVSGAVKQAGKRESNLKQALNGTKASLDKLNLALGKERTRKNEALKKRGGWALEETLDEEGRTQYEAMLENRIEKTGKTVESLKDVNKKLNAASNEVRKIERMLLDPLNPKERERVKGLFIEAESKVSGLVTTYLSLMAEAEASAVE